jgi:hypothetical protein
MGFMVEIGDLRTERIEDTLGRAFSSQGMAADTGQQLKPPMLVAAKCAIILVEALGSTTAEIRSFNESTEALTRQVLRLNWWLTVATIIGAIATLVGAVGTGILAYRALV